MTDGMLFNVRHADGSKSELLTAEDAVDDVNQRHMASLTIEDLDLLVQPGRTLRDPDGVWSVTVAS